jgi:hypothetical protein
MKAGKGMARRQPFEMRPVPENFASRVSVSCRILHGRVVRGVAVILDRRDEHPGQKFKNSGPVGFNSIPVTVQFWDRRGFFPNTLGRRLILAERDCVAD